MQRWYFVFIIVAIVLGAIIGMGFEIVIVSVLSSCMITFCMFVELTRFDRSLVWHLLQRFEVLVFIFSTYSFTALTLVKNFYFERVGVFQVCNSINYILLYSLALLMDGAPVYPLWLKRVGVCCTVMNMVLQVLIFFLFFLCYLIYVCFLIY